MVADRASLEWTAYISARTTNYGYTVGQKTGHLMFNHKFGRLNRFANSFAWKFIRKHFMHDYKERLIKISTSRSVLLCLLKLKIQKCHEIEMSPCCSVITFSQIWTNFQHYFTDILARKFKNLSCLKIFTPTVTRCYTRPTCKFTVLHHTFLVVTVKNGFKNSMYTYGHFYLDSHILLFCFSSLPCGPCGF